MSISDHLVLQGELDEICKGVVPAVQMHCDWICIATSLANGISGNLAVQDELDELCESWLADRFDVKLDFAIEESLPRLLRDGLIVHAVDESDPRLAAVDLDTAHAALLHKWETCAALPGAA